MLKVMNKNMSYHDMLILPYNITFEEAGSFRLKHTSIFKFETLWNIDWIIKQ